MHLPNKNIYYRRCKRGVPTGCPHGDDCEHSTLTPLSYTYSFQSIPARHQSSSRFYRILTIRGPSTTSTFVRFLMRPVRAESFSEELPRLATTADFQLQHLPQNQAAIELVDALYGPQNVTLELELSVFHQGSFVGLNYLQLKLFVGKYSF